MPRWTPEQQLAIDEDGKNIIVSAGAGSGKTAVLSERVIRKLEQGVNIDELLILTFTKAAAFEMMIRIRNKIKERPHLKEQLDKIDSSYITTFDSFSLSLVKKYHYLLNIKRDIKVVNQNVINMEKKKILDNIFDKYYQKKDEKFHKLLDCYTVKDDKDIKDLILNINSKLDLKYDKIPYLASYLNSFFNEDTFNKLINSFISYLKDIIKDIEENLSLLSHEVDGDYHATLQDMLSPLLSSKTYDEIKNNSEIKLKNLPRNSTEEVKKYKDNIKDSLKELTDVLIYENEAQIKELYFSNQDIIKVLIDIILELDNEIYIYKYNHDSYEFTDISKMAIKLVKENKEIRNELKYYFNEIMIDEYQDTSDLQEEFIGQIENNNVYMVGDIKQSIYRFRNANPNIFKTKYDNYNEHIGGEKIDLIKNFRSRKEVLANINYVFDYIMDDFLGGCKYREAHRMVFGNTTYEEKKNDSQNSDFEVYNYPSVKGTGYKSTEVEAFIVLKDIEEKIKNHYQVIDRDTFELRDCTYKDFAILMDRATSFELYKKIFEYKNIPLTVYKDTSITEENDIYLLSNLFKLIYLVHKKDYSEEFRYTYMSVARSNLTDDDDSKIFKTIKNNTFFESEMFEKIKPIVRDYDSINAVSLIDLVIDNFNFYERQILVGNMDSFMARISYLKTLFEEMGSLGYTLDEIILMFYEMVEEGQDIKVSMNEESEDAVKIMTIHKSKGLEFPILYMTGLSNKFNILDLNEKFIYDSSYGIIVPFYNMREIPNIAKQLMKKKYLEDEISEKIRLFYVALTRAREKMILVTSYETEEMEEIGDIVDNKQRCKYRSFLDILKSIWLNLETYKKEIELDSLNLTKDYAQIKSTNYKEHLKKKKDKIFYQELDIKEEKLEEKSFSKKTKELLTPDNYEAIKLGLRFHEIFEYLDFNKPNLDYLSDFEKGKIEKFLNLEILKDIRNAKIYKEYEFIYYDKEIKKHGIIDLLIEKEDEVLIIDYKLKHVIDDAYKKQLKGYKDYLKTKTDKNISIYLYSILDSNLKEIK